MKSSSQTPTDTATSSTLTIIDLAVLLAEFVADPTNSPSEPVILQDEYGAEVQISSGRVVNGVLFLHPKQSFEE